MNLGHNIWHRVRNVQSSRGDGGRGGIPHIILTPVIREETPNPVSVPISGLVHVLFRVG